ncbi:MAG: hypothetical protein L6R40_007175 [Gallowayella cf. fulva]|nr:MAG: hypothetical protein L6R40_007175 [Xanthomendoza cf. fulva]
MKSPEAESKRRKPSLDPQRDQRHSRVPSRRYPSLSQQAPIFETDSLLNTSSVQSPSPAKSTPPAPSHTQPRKAFNSGRSLAPTYAPTPRKTDEKKPPPSPSSSIHGNRQTPLKPRPTQTSHPAPQPARSTLDSKTNARLKTPSPIRGRKTENLVNKSNSVLSPSSSASSPPRGLAEAYQRIVDEENLAHEEAIEEMKGYSDSPTPSEDWLHDDSIGPNGPEASDSPTSLKASRRASPHALLEDGKLSKPSLRDIYERLGDTENDTHSSTPENAHSGSWIKEDSQRAKDLRRVNGALRSEPQIFRKALVGNRAGLTVENLKRNNDSSDSLDSPFAPSISSRGSDPSINVPRQWGRKARPGKDWLSRINSKSGRLTGDVPKPRILDEPSLPPTGKQSSGNHVAAAAAEIPLPSGDDVASQETSSSRSSTPTAAVLRAKSRDRVLEWESRDDDFTGRSLQVSDSPPIKTKNATLGKILEQEISTVAKRAVTTNRLGELREKGSAEPLGRRSLSQSGKDSQDGLGDRRRSVASLPLQPAKKEMKTPSKSTEGLGLGEAVPNSPVVIYRSDSSSSRANNDSLDSEETGGPMSQRPKHRREDSHSLLRQLARATSASPSPPRDMPDEVDIFEADAQIASAKEKAGISTQDHRSVLDKNADIGIQQTSSNTEDPGYTTPQQARSNAYLKTPMVTGAWIDTPLPTGGRGPPMPTPDIDDTEIKTLRTDTQQLATGDLIRKLSPHTTRPKIPDEELKKTAPRLPRSALESIINAAKTKALTVDQLPSPADSQEDPTLLLGESTIHSLEELMTNDTDVTALLQPPPNLPNTSSIALVTKMPTPTEPRPQQDDDNSPPISPITSSKSYLTDLQLSSNQLSRLRNLVPSLQETRKGLASLERAVSAPPPSKALSSVPGTGTNGAECTEAGEFHDFIWPCSRCGCPAASITGDDRTARQQTQRKAYDYDIDFARISIPIPRLWRRRRDGDWRPRLTWSGIVVLMSLLLYAAELWARDRYCHKFFAATMVGYGVDIDAPRPPFVLAKVLWRKLGMQFLLEVVNFWAAVLGWVFGFAQGREPVSRDPKIPRPEWGPDLSMMDDEYL